MTNDTNNDSVALQISKTMRQMMAVANLTEADLCRGVNLPQTTINRLLSNQTNDPRISTLLAVANFFDITVEQLIGAEQLVRSCDKQNVRGSLLPVLDWTTINHWIAAENRDKYNHTHKAWIKTESNLSNGSFATLAPASSVDFFCKNSLLLIELVDELSTKSLADGKIALISEQDESLTLRQIIIDGSAILLKQLFSPNNVSKMTTAEKIHGIVVEARQYF